MMLGGGESLESTLIPHSDHQSDRSICISQHSLTTLPSARDGHGGDAVPHEWRPRHGLPYRNWTGCAIRRVNKMTKMPLFLIIPLIEADCRALVVAVMFHKVLD